MKTTHLTNRKKVAIVIDMTAGAAARDVLSGIFKFINAGHPWSIRIIQLPSDSLLTVFPGSLDERLDGIIVTCLSDEATNKAIAASRLPTVFVDVRHSLFERRAGAVSFIRNDNEGIGAIGARYLCELGNFNAYGFVPDIDRRAWSNLRENAFVKELAARKIKANVFGGGSKVNLTDSNNLKRWILHLQKPCALMAAYDYRATQVLEVCAEAGLSVPGQVALLGVDNDELLCNTSAPPLSSISPDHVDEGFQAGAELYRLFRLGVRAKRREKTCRIRGIVKRESTTAAAPAAALLRRALAFIDANLRTNLKTDDIANGLGISRRLLERRFHDVRGESVHHCILTRRLSLVKYLLKTTRRSSAKIAAECGFSSASFLSHLFSRTVGCSMREFRASGSPEGNRP